MPSSRTIRPVPTFVAAGLLLLAAGCAPAPPSGGNVLLVVFDTTRADHLSAYGCPRPTSPNLDRLAAEGQRYDEAWSQAPWTLPAMASILTGQPPRVHGAMRGSAGIRPVAPGVTTLAERMHAAGYATGAVINVVWCSPRLSALDRGFDRYDYHETDASNLGHRDAAATTDAALDWIDQVRDRPFFLVVHYFDPHLTYDPPPPYDTMFERGDGPRVPRGFGSASQVFGIRDGSIPVPPPLRQSLIARYDGEIRFADEQFGRLREGLATRGAWDDTLVIVVGDHGEEFWEHGNFEHGHTHHRELMHIPLIVRDPRAEPGRTIDTRVQQLDVAPTVLEFAGLPAASELPGHVLGTDATRYAIGEGSLWSGELVSVRADTGTLIHNRTTGGTEYYRPEDPFELTPLPPDTAEARVLVGVIESLPTAPGEPGEIEPLDAEELERLRSLGYVE
jgi:arylsulfatase A-like enzyme